VYFRPLVGEGGETAGEIIDELIKKKKKVCYQSIRGTLTPSTEHRISGGRQRTERRAKGGREVGWRYDMREIQLQRRKKELGEPAKGIRSWEERTQKLLWGSQAEKEKLEWGQNEVGTNGINTAVGPKGGMGTLGN